MKDSPLSFGEYIHRLRRAKGWNLGELAKEAEVSYWGLSRFENDHKTPNVATVARLAQALDGDLKRMLEMANCLPQEILDRIAGGD